MEWQATLAPPLSTNAPESPHERPPASLSSNLSSARWEAAEEEQEAATAALPGSALCPLFTNHSKAPLHFSCGSACRRRFSLKQNRSRLKILKARPNAEVL